jgi:hypoxanthine phosphoribosyltransferase
MNARYSIIFSLVLSFPLMSMEVDQKKTIVVFEEVKSMCSSIAKKANMDNFKPDLLIGIARGGLIPLAILAGEPLFNNRNVTTMSVESYDDKGKQKKLKFRFLVPTDAYKAYKSILVVDDIADTGETLRKVTELLKENLPAATIKSAVLFYKPASTFKPDYYAEQTTKWIVFPWEI